MEEECLEYQEPVWKWRFIFWPPAWRKEVERANEYNTVIHGKLVLRYRLAGKRPPFPPNTWDLPY